MIIHNQKEHREAFPSDNIDRSVDGCVSINQLIIEHVLGSIEKRIPVPIKHGYFS